MLRAVVSGSNAYRAVASSHHLGCHRVSERGALKLAYAVSTAASTRVPYLWRAWRHDVVSPLTSRRHYNNLPHNKLSALDAAAVISRRLATDACVRRSLFATHLAVYSRRAPTRTHHNRRYRQCRCVLLPVTISRCVADTTACCDLRRDAYSLLGYVVACRLVCRIHRCP